MTHDTDMESYDVYLKREKEEDRCIYTLRERKRKIDSLRFLEMYDS